MKFIYKGCTYRTENLSEAQKELMKKEIQAAESKLKLAENVDTKKVKKEYKNLEE